MSNCEQTKGLTILEHGLSVHDYFMDLHSHIIEGKQLRHTWRLPDWVNEGKLWDRLFDLEIIKDYQVFHDCGKPFCREIDEQGKVHFPCHASISKEVWINHSGNGVVADLIGMDMDIHLLKMNECLEFSQRTQAATLVLTGLAEIHANAIMFGGIESTSFKIKWKQINKKGCRVIESFI